MLRTEAIFGYSIGQLVDLAVRGSRKPVELFKQGLILGLELSYLGLQLSLVDLVLVYLSLKMSYPRVEGIRKQTLTFTIAHLFILIKILSIRAGVASITYVFIP